MQDNWRLKKSLTNLLNWKKRTCLRLVQKTNSKMKKMQHHLSLAPSIMRTLNSLGTSLEEANLTKMWTHSPWKAANSKLMVKLKSQKLKHKNSMLIYLTFLARRGSEKTGRMWLKHTWLAVSLQVFHFWSRRKPTTVTLKFMGVWYHRCLWGWLCLQFPNTVAWRLA